MSSPAPFGPITELLERSLSIRHVFGEPVQHGDTTVIPAERGVKCKELPFARAILPALQWFSRALRAQRAMAASEPDDERWLLALAANMCMFAGIRRRSCAGLLLIIGGSLLAWWADAGVIRSQSL